MGVLQQLTMGYRVATSRTSRTSFSRKPLLLSSRNPNSQQTGPEVARASVNGLAWDRFRGFAYQGSFADLLTPVRLGPATNDRRSDG